MRALSILAVALIASMLGQTAPRSLGRTMVDDIVEYVVAQGETFQTIGARLGVDPTAVARRNTRWVHAPLVAGMKLTVDAHRTVPTVPSGLRRGILINVPQKLLFLLEDEGRVTLMPVAVGRRDWPTPAGTFRVTRKEIDPTWDVPLSIREEMKRLRRPLVTRVPPGPQNPLGKYWIGLSFPSLGIHGGNAPSSVPGYTTHGCIRARSDQIQSLFDRVTVGTPGEIIDEPALLTRHDGRLFVEVHSDAYGSHPDALQALARAADYLGVRDQLDWRRVEDVVRLREGLAVDVTLK